VVNKTDNRVEKTVDKIDNRIGETVNWTLK
jgi:hypothetical protein